MKQAFDLLKLAKEMFPTEYGTCHTLTVQCEGLILTLFIQDKWHSFVIFESDLNKSAKEIMDDVYDYLREYIQI